MMRKWEGMISMYLLFGGNLKAIRVGLRNLSDMTIASYRESIVNSVYGRSPDL